MSNCKLKVGKLEILLGRGKKFALAFGRIASVDRRTDWMAYKLAGSAVAVSTLQAGSYSFGGLLLPGNVAQVPF